MKTWGLRSIPNIDVISPADTTELASSRGILEVKKLNVYKINRGSNIPLIFNEDYNFSLGKSSTLKEGKDIAIYLPVQC